MAIIEELQEQRRAKQKVLDGINAEIERKQKVNASVAELLKEKITKPTFPGSSEDILEFRNWFAKVKALQLEGFNSDAQALGWNTAYSTPNFPFPPTRLMENVKGTLHQFTANNGTGHEIDLKDSLENQIKELDVAIQSLKDSSGGLRWSRLGVIVAIGATLLATFIFETFKPEITGWIRHLAGLPPLP